MASVLPTPSNQISLQSNSEQTLALIERCSNMKELKQIHAQVLKNGSSMLHVAMNKLLALCAKTKFNDLAYARMIFDRMSSPNTLVWNTMLSTCSNSNDPEAALLLYHQMLYHSVSHNSYTFPNILKACSNLSAMQETEQIHAQIIKRGFGSEIYAINSLLRVYAILGSFEAAHVLFDHSPQRDIVSWNTMIDGCIRCGNIDTAYEMFKAMPVKNVISWTTMIVGFVRAGLNKEALSLFQQMLMAGIKPDTKTLSCSLSACAGLGALDQGQWIHSYIDKNGIKLDPILGCVLIDMYVKCGVIKNALEVFRKLDKKCVCAWTAMISGFAIHGKGKEALDWFMQMEKAGIRPTSITFTAVLTACSHAGLIKEGKSLFESIVTVYKMNPSLEHYGCMVDLLGRAGRLKEAKEFIESMPLKPNAAIWGALLNACVMHRHLELGKEIGRILTKMDPDHGGRYVHLASIHAAAGEWNQAVQVRRQIKNRGILNAPGCSTITLNGVVHEFLAGAGSDSPKDIYDMWDHLC